MHPRTSVSAICSFRLDLRGDLELWGRLGVTRAGVSVAKLEANGWDAGEQAVADSGIEVANLIGLGPFLLDDPSGWEEQRRRLVRAVDAAARLGAPVLVLTTGPAGSLGWEEAADALGEAAAPVVAHAAGSGVRIALEHTNSLRPDVGFVHTLRDAMDVADRLGCSVCVELNACWAERAVHETLRDHVDRIGLVQVSDYAIGTRSTPARLVPGDGDIPLEALLRTVLDAGYAGDFDLELIGPAIDDEGYDSAIPRAVRWLDATLTRLGA